MILNISKVGLLQQDLWPAFHLSLSYIPVSEFVRIHSCGSLINKWILHIQKQYTSNPHMDK